MITLIRVCVASLTVAAMSGSALANQHPHPHKGSLGHLDRNSYASNISVLGPDTLKVEGCVGAICGGENWTRTAR